MWEPEIQRLFLAKFGERALFSERLAPYLAYGVGGPADCLLTPQTEEELTWIAAICRTHSIPLTIVGTGTNLLVRDEGIRGVTLMLRDAFRGVEIEQESGDKVWVRAGGGVSKPDLLEWAVQRGLRGLEFSSGVPGTIGGGIFMNAGTKYGCYGDLLRKVRLFDFEHGAKEFTTDRSLFGYREQKLVKNTLVLWATFELVRGDREKIRAEVNRIIAERAEKQPLDFPSCGSTFKNPEGYSAGRLIEKAGLKGMRVGGAEISEKHANFILNKGHATAQDLLTLIEMVKVKVKAESNIDLECEVIILGGNRNG
jgi:UDP-N-acetylmuramate dehydrogenase